MIKIEPLNCLQQCTEQLNFIKYALTSPSNSMIMNLLIFLFLSFHTVKYLSVYIYISTNDLIVKNLLLTYIARNRYVILIRLMLCVAFPSIYFVLLMHLFHPSYVSINLSYNTEPHFDLFYLYNHIN